MSSRQKLGVAAALLAFFVISGLLNFGYQWYDDLAREKSSDWRVPLLEELTGSFGTALLLVPILFLTLRFPFSRSNWPYRLPMHAVGLVLFSLSHTSLLAASRSVLSPLLGLGAYDYGVLAVRYQMEAFNDVLDYAKIVALISLISYYWDSRQRELGAAKLETELQRARLDKLRAQLDPHFLFNSLNAISARMYEDVKDADRMLGRLSDLLRISLKERGHLISLEEELKSAQIYLDIMQLRFPDRLSTDVQIEPEALTCQVPSMVLQPLLENALHHAVAKTVDPCRVSVVGRMEIDTDQRGLSLQVTDDGPGFAGTPMEGIGLDSIRQRLTTLFGPQATLTLDSPPEGGCRATIDIPVTTAPETNSDSGPTHAVAETLANVHPNKTYSKGLR